jgi:predicted metal-dependent peptidase
MTTAYCVDISGSMGDDYIKAAFDFIRSGIEPGDSIIVFDVRAVVVSLDYINNPCVYYGRGGTDVKECLDLVKKLGHYNSILISDGWTIEEDIKKFSKFINVESLIK